MAEVLVITSGKGGVGKTTTTANLGVALALAGRSVALVDADIGLRNLDLALGLENDIAYDVLDVVSGACVLRQALIRDRRWGNLWLLPAAQHRDKAALAPEQMQDILLKLKESYDYVLVDSPAGIEQGFRNAIAGADRAVIVTVPEVTAVRDGMRVKALLDECALPVGGIVVNRFRPRMAKRGEILDVEETISIIGADLLGVIPEDEDVVRSGNFGEPLAAGNTPAAKAYKQLAARIQGSEPEQTRSFGSLFKGLFGRAG